MTAKSNHEGNSTGAEIDFFARMTASVSHELKNVLAIINENAGLLEDLLLMAERGRPLSPERLQRLAVNVKGQVDRGDAIICRLNRFAHTVYDPVGLVDLREMCELVAALTARLAAMQEVKVQVMPVEKVNAEVHPFFLANALWLLLKHIFPLVQGGTLVQLRPVLTGGCPCIDVRVEGVPVEVLAKTGQDATGEGEDILAAVNGVLEVLQEEMTIRLCLGKTA